MDGLLRPDRPAVPPLFSYRPVHLSFLWPSAREPDGTAAWPFPVRLMRDRDPLPGNGGEAAPLFLPFHRRFSLHSGIQAGQDLAPPASGNLLVQCPRDRIPGDVPDRLRLPRGNLLAAIP